MRAAVAMLAALIVGGPALAQDAAALTGRWTGEVSEPGADIPRYRMQANIVIDRGGVPIGTVRYEALNCAGAWVGTVGAAGMRFDEIITEDEAGRCDPEMEVELVPQGDRMTARFRDHGSAEVRATATLRRWR